MQNPEGIQIIPLSNMQSMRVKILPSLFSLRDLYRFKQRASGMGILFIPTYQPDFYIGLLSWCDKLRHYYKFHVLFPQYLHFMD